MSVRVGISVIAWQNDDLPDLTRDFTTEQALREARQIGYTGVERGQRMPPDTEGLRAYLDAADVALCGGWCSGNLLVNTVEEEIAAISAQVEQFTALGAPCVVYSECSNTIQDKQHIPLSQRPRLSREDMLAYAARLGEVAKWVQGQGMTLAYHHHMGSIVEAPEDLDALMEGSDPALRLCFDTGHMLFGGGDVMAMLTKWSDRVHHVHFKDIRPEVVADVRENDRSFLDAVIAGAFTVPGDGCIDFQAVADHLKSIDYNGWIVVEAEQDPAKAPPYAYSEKGYHHILDVCARSGLAIEG